jgi:hypothetical protein
MRQATGFRTPRDVAPAIFDDVLRGDVVSPHWKVPSCGNREAIENRGVLKCCREGQLQACLGLSMFRPSGTPDVAQGGRGTHRAENTSKTGPSCTVVLGGLRTYRSPKPVATTDV